MEQAERVLKQDAAGRVWTPPERREAVLDEFERSGLPAAQFAAHVGVKYPTFANWVQKRRQAREGAKVTEGQTPIVPRLSNWVEASVESMVDGVPSMLVVHLPGGVHLEVSNAMQAKLAACLLRALGEGAGVC
jgi:hypothetical protein